MVRLERLTGSSVEALHVLCTGAGGEFAQAKEVRETWLREMFEKGLTGWIAYEGETPVGYIEYMPLEQAPYNVTGEGGQFITCLWVLREHRGKGVGSALLRACMDDCPDGVSTLAYRGVDHKPAEFFERVGFQAVREEGIAVLLTRGDVQISLAPSGLYVPRQLDGRLAVDVLYNPQCPYSYRVAERFQGVVEGHPRQGLIDLLLIDVWAERERLGLSGGIFLNGQAAAFETMGPPDQGEIRRVIDEALLDLSSSWSDGKEGTERRA